MVTIPTVYGFPSFDGRYNGEMVYDANSFCLYVWTIPQYNTVGSWTALGQQGVTGPTGVMGPAGKDADQELLDALVIKVQWLEKAVDLFIAGKIDSKEYLNLKKMMNSADDDTATMALKTLKMQHEKHFGE